MNDKAVAEMGLHGNIENQRKLNMGKQKSLFPALLVIAAGLSAVWWGIASGKPHISWLIAMLAIVTLFAIVGQSVIGAASGVLIDRRNVMSLSRFQMTLWTILLASAILVAALWNLHLELDDPLGFAIPSEVWGLMGIAATSMAGSSLIVGTKAVDGQPNDAQFERQKAMLQDSDKVSNVGLVVVNTDPGIANWTDMITGDETGNAAQIDLSKCQMLLFTLVTTLLYGASLWTLFVAMGHEGGFTKFPAFDSSLLTMIGISHAGYLVYKATPHSEKAEAKQDLTS